MLHIKKIIIRHLPELRSSNNRQKRMRGVIANVLLEKPLCPGPQGPWVSGNEFGYCFEAVTGSSRILCQ